MLVASRGSGLRTHPSSPGSAASSPGSCRTGARATRPVAPTTPPCSSAKRWSGCSGCSAAPQGVCSCSRTCTGRTRRRWRSSTTSPTPSPPSGCCAWPPPGRPDRRTSRTCWTGSEAAGSALSSPSLPSRTGTARTWCAPACPAPRRSTVPCSAFVAEHSDGLPFLIEELLAGLVTSGALTREDGRWRAEQAPTPSVPASFAASLGTRLQTLDPDARHVLAAAAVLGRRFDWDLLPGVAAVDGATVVGSLRRAVDAQLVAVDGQRFRFRHALTREAVLAELLPPERAELSGRALVAVHRAHPGLPGPWCELAAELAEGAGDRETAAALTTESAHRALARGALASAELTAERARSLASPGSAAAGERPRRCWSPSSLMPGSPDRPGRSGTGCCTASTSWVHRRHGGSSCCSSSCGPRSPRVTRTPPRPTWRAPGRRAISIPGCAPRSTRSAHTSHSPTTGSTRHGGSRRRPSPERTGRRSSARRSRCSAAWRRRPTRWPCSDGAPIWRNGTG